MFVHWSVRRSWGTADAEGSDDTAMGDKGQKRAPLAGLMRRSCAHQNPRGKISPVARPAHRRRARRRHWAALSHKGRKSGQGDIPSPRPPHMSCWGIYGRASKPAKTISLALRVVKSTPSRKATKAPSTRTSVPPSSPSAKVTSLASPQTTRISSSLS